MRDAAAGGLGNGLPSGDVNMTASPSTSEATPLTLSGTPGKCRVCGCTEASACQLPDGACSWVPGEGRTLCDTPACLQKASKALWEEYWSAANGPVEGKPTLDAFRRLYNRACRLTQLLEDREMALRGLI